MIKFDIIRNNFIFFVAYLFEVAERETNNRNRVHSEIKPLAMQAVIAEVLVKPALYRGSIRRFRSPQERKPEWRAYLECTKTSIRVPGPADLDALDANCTNQVNVRHKERIA